MWYKAKVHWNVHFLAPEQRFEILLMKLDKGGRCSALAAVLLHSEHEGSNKIGSGRLHTPLGRQQSQCGMLLSNVVFCCRYSCGAPGLSYQATKETGPNIRDKQQVCHFNSSLSAREEAGSTSRAVMSTGSSLGEGFIWHNMDAFPIRSSLLVCGGAGSRIWEQGKSPLHMTSHASNSKACLSTIDTRVPVIFK